MYNVSTRRKRLFLLVSILAVMLGGFNFPNRTAQADPGAGYSCPAPSGCGNFGCNANGQGVQKCSLYNLEGSTTCSGSIDCEKTPEEE